MILPLLGFLAYLLVRGPSMAQRSMASAAVAWAGHEAAKSRLVGEAHLEPVRLDWRH